MSGDIDIQEIIIQPDNTELIEYFEGWRQENTEMYDDIYALVEEYSGNTAELLTVTKDIGAYVYVFGIAVSVILVLMLLYNVVKKFIE